MVKPTNPKKGEPKDSSDKPSSSEGSLAQPDGFRGINPKTSFDDNRKRNDWRSRYDQEAQKKQLCEAWIVGVCLLFFLVCAGVSAGFDGDVFEIALGGGHVFYINTKLILMYFSGCLGGTIFSIKWLIHTVAKGYWNDDRFYWRVFVPFIGGVYAIVVLILMDSGLLGVGSVPASVNLWLTGALSFLVGYFSDGVSGLLTNVANAIFGTVERK